MNKIYNSARIYLNAISLIFLSILIFSCDGTGKVDPQDPDEDLSAYITEVFEYVYAPGQHAKSVKKEDAGKFIGKPKSELLLGGFGGYVIAGFNHDVINKPGEYDFEVFSSGISPEPAIVYVMCDENGDGIPNEKWYELKGSLFNDTATILNYSVTYNKPPSAEFNITWTDSHGASGELKEGNKAANSTSHWWWDDTKEQAITFTGTRLPKAYINKPLENISQNWVVPDTLFQWGYAENNYGADYSRETGSNKFDIGNAVDENGNSVDLQHIRFIKIQTAVFQQAGWLNEISSEVQGARDLHYQAKQ